MFFVLATDLASEHADSRFRNAEKVTSADSAFDGFFAGCAAMPSNCVLAADNKTGPQLRADFESFLNTTTAEQQDDIKGHILQTLYSPSKYPQLAKDIQNGYDTAANLSSANITTTNSSSVLRKYKRAIFPAPNKTPQAINGIEGGDHPHYANTSVTLYASIIDAYDAVSPYFGETGVTNVLGSAVWQITAKEIYKGNFAVQTLNPLLVIGNSHDPITPLVSAQNVTVTFSGASLIHQDSYGVSIIFNLLIGLVFGIF